MMRELLNRISAWYFTKAPTGKPLEILPPHYWRMEIDHGALLLSFERIMPSNRRYWRTALRLP